MAKYRITSIPGSLPKAQDGKTFKNWVPKEEGQQVDQPVTGIQQPSYWNDMLSPVVRGEQCPPGKFPYNGTCVTESEYMALVKQETELEDAQTAREKKARDEAFVQARVNVYESLGKEQQNQFKNDVDTYYDKFKKSKKSDKIEPFERISLSDLDPAREKELQSEYLINKNSETGYAELYPKSIVFDRIIHNGFQANQFKNYWGLDPKQVKEQVGDLMTAADAQYDATVTQKILKKALDEGKSPEEIIAGLPSTLGTKSGLKTKFEKPIQKLINDGFKQTGDAIVESIPNVDRDKIYGKDSDIFLESRDPQTAWENKYYNPKIDLGAYLNYHGKKIEEGDKAYKSWMNEHGQNPNQDLRFAKDDAMANQRNANAEINRMVTNVLANKAWKKEHGKSKKFDQAAVNYMSNLAGNEIKDVYRQALNNASLSTKDKLKFLKEFETNPNSAVESLLNTKVGKGKKTYANMLSENIDNAYMSELTRPQLKQGTSNNENTTASKIMDVLHHPFDAAYFAMDPRREMWGDYNQSYDTRMDIGKRTGADTGLMPNDNPLAIVRDYTLLQALNPFKIGFNLNKGMHEGRLLGAIADELIDIGTKKGIVKGFNALGNLGKAGNIAAGTNLLGTGTKGVGLAKNLKKGAGALWSGFNNPAMNVGYLLETPENISNAYSDLKQGNYGSAALNTAYAGFGAAPILSGLKTLKSLRTPGTVLTNPNLNTQYTGMYNAATPGSGIGIGNPSLNTAQPVFQSLTNPVNKLTKGLGFGEFSVLKQNPNIPVTPMPYNKALQKDGGLVKAQIGRFIQSGKDISRLLKPTNEFRKTLSGLENMGDLPNVAPVLNKIAKPPIVKPVTHNVTLDKLKDDVSNYSNPGGTSLIQHGEETHKGLPWVWIDPEDHINLGPEEFGKMEWFKDAMKDASKDINRGLSYNNLYNNDTFDNVGDFDFKDFSGGWLARQNLLNMASTPQKKLNKNDFYTEAELINLVNKQSEWQAARNAFDDMEPEDPGMVIFNALSGDNSREELFSSLFPNAAMPNFRSKFTTPSQEALLQQSLPWQYSVKNQGLLNPINLKTINATEDRLPKTYQDLLKASKDNYFARAPAEHVVGEMRGVLGLKAEEVDNASPEQLEKWRQQIVKKMNKQKIDRWNKDLAIPYKGKDAYKQISDVPGYKNKKGGIVTSLTRKEIDQYIKDGYIIEDE
jgi:hypothetical protein